MLANDIKKGMRVLLKSGWYGTMYDNRKGNIRMCEVEGIYTEIGSVYAKDITEVQTNPLLDIWEKVELSPTQKKQAANIRAAGF